MTAFGMSGGPGAPDSTPDPDAETQLTLVLAAGGIGTWAFEADPPRKTWNATTRALFGVSETAEVTSETFLARLHPDDLARYSHAFAAAVDPAGPGRYACEFRIRRADTGAGRWLSSRGQSSFQDGRFLRMAGVVEDVTERKRAKEQLRQSETLFRTMADELPLIVWLHDAEGAQEFVNQTFCDYFGVTREEMHDERWIAYVHPEDLPAYRESFLAAVRDRQDFHALLRVRRADGEWRWMESWGRPRFDADGAYLGHLGASADITERVESPRALAASEQRFRGVFDNAATGIAILDLRGRYQRCNAAFADMVGYSEAELRALGHLSLVHPEDRDHMLERIGALVRGEISGFEVTNRHVSKDGSIRWSQRYITFLHDDKARPVNVLVLATDMTERMTHQQEIEMLLGEMSHRAKNTLTVVQAIARFTAASGQQDFLARFSERIRAIAASHDLLFRSEWRGVDMTELVASQLSHLEDLFGARVHAHGPSVRVSASAAQTLGLCLNELATNAMKHGALSSPGGEISLGWNCDGVTFDISWVESGGLPVHLGGSPGFGTMVLQDMAGRSLDAAVVMEGSPDGLIWRLSCPAGTVLEATPEPR